MLSRKAAQKLWFGLPPAAGTGYAGYLGLLSTLAGAGSQPAKRMLAEQVAVWGQIMNAPYLLAWLTALTIVWIVPFFWLREQIDANGAVRGRLRCQGYYFGWNPDFTNRFRIPNGRPEIKLDNLADEPITAIITHFSASLNGKTTEGIGDEIVNIPFVVQGRATVDVRPRAIDIDFTGPGDCSGEVELDLRYGIDEKHARLSLSRRYKLTLHIDHSGNVHVNGVEVARR